MRFYANLEVKSLEEDGKFSGYGAVFNTVDHGNDIIQKGAFTRTLAEFKRAGTMPVMPWDHKLSDTIGDWISMAEDHKGLFVEGQLWLGQGIQNAQRAYKMMKGTGSKGLSIGFVTKQSDRDSKGRRLLQELEIIEVSPTPIPMNPEATVLRVKSLNGGVDPQKLESMLRDECGLSAREAKSLMDGGFRALSSNDQDSSSELSSIVSLINKRFP
jgi:HK97 family phage prohead protease